MSKRKYFLENQEYFRYESFLNLIVRKINTRASRTSEKFIHYKKQDKISLETLTDDAGIAFNYGKNAVRDFNKLLTYFKIAVDREILDDFYITTYDEENGHTKHEVIPKGRKRFQAPTVKKIKDNKNRIYFNYVISDAQINKLKGNGYCLIDDPLKALE